MPKNKKVPFNEEEPTQEEKKMIEEALKEYKVGQTYSFEEVFGEDN